MKMLILQILWMVEFVSNSLIINNVVATEDDYDVEENILTIYLNNVDNKTSKKIIFQVKNKDIN